MKDCCLLVTLGSLLFCGCFGVPATEQVMSSELRCASIIDAIDSSILLKTRWHDCELQGTISLLDLFAKIEALDERQNVFVLTDGTGRVHWLTPDDNPNLDNPLGWLPQIDGLYALAKTRTSGVYFLSEKPDNQYSMTVAITILLWPWQVENEGSDKLRADALETLASPFLYPCSGLPTEPLGTVIGLLIMDSLEDSISYAGKDEVRRIFEDGLTDCEKDALKSIIQDPDWKTKVILSLFRVRP